MSLVDAMGSISLDDSQTAAPGDAEDDGQTVSPDAPFAERFRAVISGHAAKVASAIDASRLAMKRAAEVRIELGTVVERAQATGQTPQQASDRVRELGVIGGKATRKAETNLLELQAAARNLYHCAGRVIPALSRASRRKSTPTSSCKRLPRKTH